MELLAANDDNVTIQFDEAEFAQLCSLVLSVLVQYDSLDDVELGLTSAQVQALLEGLEKIGESLP